ncbi:ATP-NAD kinase family protein [Pontibacter sp. JAM-7]|uniref:ATP-NAD kinase family protein n=1 Tax=Pontibacter sp. JAM-7 TaxID=3366581 RepID=UPI003AF61248
MFRLGLIINPLAGLGGSVALKGSDGADTAVLAKRLGAEPKAGLRTLQALQVLQNMPVQIVTYPGEMGADIASEAGFEPEIVGSISSDATRPADTCNAVRDLYQAGIDLLLFAGGDGTARDICDVLPEGVPVLGIPAGVKIHSGVYALTPKAAGDLVALLVRGDLVTLEDQEVRDLDEEAFRQGQVRARFYGEMQVPAEHRFLQHVKNSGREDEALVLDDIAADVIERMEPGTCYIMGSGSTVAAVMEQLGLPNTLLGVDLVRDGELLAADCTAAQLLSLTEGQSCALIITLIGGQGHIIGRGNQQLSPELIKRIGRQNIHIIATKTKLSALEGRPLIVDSGDPEANQMLAGVLPVITGYRDAVLYRVADY